MDLAYGIISFDTKPVDVQNQVYSKALEGQNQRTPSGGEVQHLRSFLIEFIVLEDIWCGQLGELGPKFDHLLVLGLLIEMFSIGFNIIVLLLRGAVLRIVVTVVVRHAERDTSASGSASEVDFDLFTHFMATFYTCTLSLDDP